MMRWAMFWHRLGVGAGGLGMGVVLSGGPIVSDPSELS